MRNFLVVAVMAAGATVLAQSPSTVPAGPLQAELESRLVRELDQLASSLDGVAGYVVTDLTSGKRVAARLEREPFPTASAIKLSVLYELLKQAEAGTLQLETPVPVRRADLVGGSGVLQASGYPVPFAPRPRHADDHGQ